jgi:hypothetical protein
MGPRSPDSIKPYQTSFAAETWALWTLLRNARNITRNRILILIDTWGVCKQAKQWAEGKRRLLSNMPAIWSMIRTEIRRHEGRITFAWIPSHGKTSQWSAPAGYSTEDCRKLNELADAEATEQMSLRWLARQNSNSLRTRFHDRSHITLARMRVGSHLMMDRYFDEDRWCYKTGRRMNRGWAHACRESSVPTPGFATYYTSRTSDPPMASQQATSHDLPGSAPRAAATVNSTRSANVQHGPCFKRTRRSSQQAEPAGEERGT